MTPNLRFCKQVRWLSVVGARPQFIKLAAICRAIDTHNRGQKHPTIEHTIVHTGQHYDHEMAELFFLQLDMPKPRYDLEAGSGSHGAQLARMIERLEPVLNTECPDRVIVYGDTNSTAAGALLASRLGYAVAHVEAGCRSHNWKMPEEQNRVLADHVSQILLAPSQNAVENLRREGIGVEGDPRQRKVAFVGDVMYDILLASLLPVARLTKRNMEGYQLKPKRYYLLTLHRAENTQDPEKLLEILTSLQGLDLPVLFPMHPRTRKVLIERRFSWDKANIKVIAPVGYLDMLALEKSACKILTDSGGVQKEAFYLRVPCITLRDETEWPETVALGANRLTGADRAKIISAVRETGHPFSSTPAPFGNGKASERIVNILASEAVSSLDVVQNNLSPALQAQNSFGRCSETPCVPRSQSCEE